jgi:hypothetical protein
MNGCEIRFCPQCGTDGVGTREITPNHILELHCPHCGFMRGGGADQIVLPPQQGGDISFMIGARISG